MKPIAIKEPRPKYVRLYVTEQEREDAEFDLLLQAGWWKYLFAWLSVFCVGILWAARYWIGWAH